MKSLGQRPVSILPMRRELFGNPWVRLKRLARQINQQEE
jgi:hypothetical protein